MFKTHGFFLAVGNVLLSQLLWAQRQPRPEDTFAGCAACGVLIFIPIGFLILDIVMLVWVARDAKARGMDSAVLWMLLVFFTSFIGLIIYLLARPQGNTIPCATCGNKRLQASAKCPHCGNA